MLYGGDAVFVLRHARAAFSCGVAFAGDCGERVPLLGDLADGGVGELGAGPLRRAGPASHWLAAIGAFAERWACAAISGG